MKLAKILSEMFRPTFPKIILYVSFVFMAPTVVNVCTEGVCSWKFSFFVGYGLLTHKSMGVFTFGAMWLMFLIAYLFATLTVSTFNTIKQKQKLG